MKAFVVSFVLTLLLIWVLWAIANALAVPVVEWSWTTDECVRVLPPKGGDCRTLPERYTRVWVR